MLTAFLPVKTNLCLQIAEAMSSPEPRIQKFCPQDVKTTSDETDYGIGSLPADFNSEYSLSHIGNDRRNPKKPGLGAKPEGEIQTCLLNREAADGGAYHDGRAALLETATGIPPLSSGGASTDNVA